MNTDQLTYPFRFVYCFDWWCITIFLHCCVFGPAFKCVQHPKAGRKTQHYIKKFNGRNMAEKFTDILNELHQYNFWKDIGFTYYVKGHKQNHNFLNIVDLCSLSPCSGLTPRWWVQPDAIFNWCPEDDRCSLMTYQGRTFYSNLTFILFQFATS